MSEIKFVKQSVNANKHTPHGMELLKSSVQEYGWIGAITTARNGEVFDGSARLDILQTECSHVEPIVVDTDGTRPLIVRRIDIEDGNDPKAKKLGIAANRIAELNLDWDYEILQQLSEEIDLQDWFTDNDLAHLQEVVELPEKLIVDDAVPSNITTRLADVQFQIGELRFSVDQKTYEKWIGELKLRVGTQKDNLCAEIRKMLGI